MPELWRNWAGDQRCAPARVVRPTDDDGAVAAVAAARADGLRVRAVGSGHSFTDIACTDGVMVDTSGLSGVLDVDEGTGRVTVAAGTKLHALGPALAAHGLALENQGDIDAQGLAGALATATHGTGARLGNLSSRVVGMRLVTGTGEVVDVDEASDPEGLLAARVSLGALGLATRVTVQCVPLYTLRRHDAPLPLDDTLARLDEHVDGHDHFELFLWPYTRTAMTRRTERTTDELPPTPAWKRVVQEQVVENQALGAVCRTGRRLPGQVPRLNRLIASAMSESHVQDRGYRVYATRRAVRFNESEYAVPRAHAAEALTRALDLVERRRLPILFPFEVRFSAADDAFLSTAHDRETCYIAAHQYVGMEYETFFRAFEEIMRSYGGRPHWGKRHYRTAADLAPDYPQGHRFSAVRDRMDPDGVFVNDYTRRVLGEVGA